jgi:hypothetical protein
VPATQPRTWSNPLIHLTTKVLPKAGNRLQ